MFVNAFVATADKLDELKSREGANTLPVGYIRKNNGTVSSNIRCSLSQKHLKLAYFILFLDPLRERYLVINRGVQFCGCKAAIATNRSEESGSCCLWTGDTDGVKCFRTCQQQILK